VSATRRRLAAIWRTVAGPVASDAERRRLFRFQPQVERLEEREVLTQVITPVAGAHLIGANPGNNVQLRKGSTGYISDRGYSVTAAEQLFALPQSDANVVAVATDNGVPVINYVDVSSLGTTSDFANPRDIGIGPLKAVKTTGPAGAIDSGTFNPGAEDDDFAMVASGFIYLPSAGPWTFSVLSDDGNRLLLGTNNAVVTEYDSGRPARYGNNQGGTSGQPGVTDSVAIAPAAGYYPYQLLYWQGPLNAVVQFAAVEGAQPEPTDGSSGFLPTGSRLVGDPANGGLNVFQDVLSVTQGSPVRVGSRVTYNISVVDLLPPGFLNPLPLNVTLNDMVPNHTTFQSFAAPAGWTVNRPAVGHIGNVTATNPNVAAGGTANFTLVVNVVSNPPAGTTIDNSVTVSGPDVGILLPPPGIRSLTVTQSTPAAHRGRRNG
jgi:hypothetical protein